MPGTQRQSDTAAAITMRGLLRDRRFTSFFTGRLVSLLGSSMTPVALAFAVLDTSRNSTDLGIVVAAHIIPLIAFVLVGGSIGDRFSRALVLRFSNYGSGITQLIVAAVLITGHYSLTFVAVMEFLNGALDAFTTPALRGIVPQLVDKRNMQQANSLLASARNACKVIGPSVAGVLVVTVGGGWAIAIDGISFVLAGLMFSTIELPPLESRETTSMLHSIRVGWHEFRRIPWMWRVVASFTLINIVQTGVWQVLGPIIAKGTIGEASWGVVLSVKAVGVLITGIVMYRVVVVRLLTLGQLCTVLAAAPLILLGTHSGVFALAAAGLVAGLGSGVSGVAWDTTIQENIPGRILSRMAAYDDFGSYVGIPIGQLLAAPLALVLGAQHVALAGGIIFAVVALVPLLSPVVRSIRHPPLTEPA
jgi:MFS family permease